MLKSDTIRLQHVIDAANEAVHFIAGKSNADLSSDRKLALAVIKCIEIAGEAASKVTAYRCVIVSATDISISI